MPPGADLFVVCKQCGAEVSPYITECPYCGNRIRKRAPKLPRERIRGRRPGFIARRSRRAKAPMPSLGRLRRGEIPGVATETRPYVPAAIALATAGIWVAWHGGALSVAQVTIHGPLDGEWWRLITTQFTYEAGFSGYLYGFAALAATAIFGTLLERRHGAAPVIALFLGGGVAGALAALAVYPETAWVTGANAGALALLAAWAVPDLVAARRGEHPEGDLLAAGAIACVLLVMPFAREDASWTAGLTGTAIGLLAGAGLHRLRPQA